ncbi:hypothetical protein DRP53_06490 [candidate division WOR-3 bacterium]|uniref:Uncharacterized protein n=1 Tax=candidate division WOR-3 bacterium TaxID=2052148 RepID=A0A660SIN1_UNCW3|nr:MAG: hypothetical protein DRP53_06490 [candidate division WOR-3 bacterium]
MRAKILIFSRNPDTPNIKDALDPEGHEVYLASDSDTALSIIAEKKPDLILLDARGFEYEEFLRAGRAKHPEAEFILITSLDLQTKIVRDLKIDVAGFLIPPFAPDRTRMVTNRALRQTELARENRRLQAAVAAAKEEWEATVDAIEDPIFIIDFDYSIKRANLAFFRVLGKGVAEVIGKKCFEVLSDFDEATARSLCDEIKKTGGSVSRELEMKGLGGRYQVTGYPLVYSGGGGFAIYMRKK